MTEFTLAQFQDYLADKYQNKVSSLGLFMKLVEEIGEVAEALNEIEGRKAVSSETSLAYELADVLHYAVAIAAANDIDLTQSILEKDQKASAKYQHRVNLSQFLEE